MSSKASKHLTVAGGHMPTDESRQLVRAWADVGASRDLIARELAIHPYALEHHYAAELAGGEARGVARVAAALYAKAIAGDVAAATFFLKSKGRRVGWVDREDDKPSTVVQLDLVKTITQTISALRHGAAGEVLPVSARTIEQRPAEDGRELL